MGACGSKPSVQAVSTPAPLPEAAPQQQASNAAAAAPEARSPRVSIERSGGDEGGGDGYCGAPNAVCELSRIRHLNSLGILHTKPEQRFDDITKLCTMVFKVPIALVSLVDTKEQWFKSAQGLGSVDATPRNTSFCAWTLLPAYPEALVVEDAEKDARFKANPLVVGAPHIRFYAGCPLVASNGLRLGSLCIIDKAPRSFDAESCNMLANMAEMVIREIEKDRALQEQQLAQQRSSEHQQLLRAIDCFNEAIMLVQASPTRDWAVVFANEAWEKLVGAPRPQGREAVFWDLFQLPHHASEPGGSVRIAAEYAGAIARQQNFELLLTLSSTRGAAGEAAAPPRWVQAQFRCAANTGLDRHMLPIGIPNTLPNAASGDGSEAAKTFYFATLQLLSPPAAAGGGSASAPSSSNSSSAAERERRRPASRLASFAIIGGNEPFADIKLGPLLGKGAFGKVFRGSWNGRLVAVKVIEYTQQQNADGTLLEGLLSEQVAHPNVVATYRHATRAHKLGPGDEGAGGAAGDLDGGRGCEQVLETWLVLEFCNRGCISDAVDKGWFRRGLAPDMPAILATAREMASALTYLHDKSILHGDLTGNNVLLTVAPAEARGWVAKISDFGLSRLISNEAPIIETRTYGTVTHMPPELLLQGHMSKAVDVYSFGVVVWEMYSSRRPYAGLSHSQVLHAVSRGNVLQLPPNTPPGFRRFLEACLAPDPAARPSFHQICEQLTAMEAEL